MNKNNPFERKYVEKMLLKAHMPHAENKRKCRSYLRKMARHIENAWEVGRRDGLDGNPLIPLEELSQNNDSSMGREMVSRAYVAGSLGYSVGDASLAIGLMANSSIKASQAGKTSSVNVTFLHAARTTLFYLPADAVSF